MTIETSYGKAHYSYKLNEYNGRELLRRSTRYNSRWVQIAVFDTTAHALLAMMALRPDDGVERGQVEWLEWEEQVIAAVQGGSYGPA